MAYLPAYSSLHRLWVDFVLFSKQFTRSDAGCQRGNPQEAAKTIAYNLCTIHKKDGTFRENTIFFRERNSIGLQVEGKTAIMF